MDQHSASIANMIVGNNKNESLLEFTLMGPTLLFNNNYTISFTGGDFELMINDSKIEMYKPINVKIGDILKVNHTKSGARGYLAVSGTIDIDSFLGSKSFFKNITRSNYLKNGDEIIQIEAILSGTMSYIFNTYANTNDSFVQVVKNARKSARSL